MKKLKILLGASAIAVAGFFMVAADHIDAPDVAGGTSDITDYYAFQGEDDDNIAFVANVQGLLSPTGSAAAAFDENVLVEINIDTDLDAVEDLLIQAIARDGKMYVFGPFPAGASAGTSSTINTTAPVTVVDITAYGTSAVTTTNSSTGVMAFAGPRDDPFFFDFDQYLAILDGSAPGGFVNPGTDKFAGTNVLSIVVEVPKSLIGGSGKINSWVETKSK